MDLHIIVLAAGKGTRMKSHLPKVLHALGGKPLLQHVLDTAAALGPAAIHVVYGHRGDLLKQHIQADRAGWVVQEVQRGTGDAVAKAMVLVPPGSQVLVLYGDVPMIGLQTLRDLLDASGNGLGLLTVTLEDPSGYGRILRNADGAVAGIVEQKDANLEQRQIREVNTGILTAPSDLLAAWLPRLRNDNAQGEYYLTDIVAMAAVEGVSIHSLQPRHGWEVDGVNDRVQLARLERILQGERARDLMLAGVTLMDPSRIEVRGSLVAGADCVIDVNAVFEGQCRLGSGVVIGPNCLIRNASLGDGVVVEANSVIDEAEIGDSCHLGPFARIRPGSRLDPHSRVGNFVEIKKAHLGEGSKVNHLSYIGDATVGRDVNIGAGTITCNYDGVNKHQTVIGDGVFVGSNTALVAPVVLGDGVTIGAGSTITKNVEAGHLAVARGQQRDIRGWKRPAKKSAKGE